MMALIGLIGLCVLSVNGDSIGDDADMFTLALTLQSSTSVDIGQSAFNQMFWDSPTHILKRECSTCGSTHQVIYYKRYTDLDSFDLYTYTYDWESTNNVLGTDFNLFSTLEDALADTNAWTYCNYNDNNIGMFRDCGPTGHVPSEWTSRTRGGDSAAFYIMTSFGTTEPPSPMPTAVPTMEPTKNCDLLHIDEYLLDCSSEWNAAGNTRTSMQSSIDTNAADIVAATTSIASNAEDISTNAADIVAVKSTADSNAADVTAVESSVSALESRVKELEDILEQIGVNSAARSAVFQAVDDAKMVKGVSNGVTVTGKDLGIVALAAINVIMIVIMVIACKGSGRRTKYQPVAVGSDMEPINA